MADMKIVVTPRFTDHRRVGPIISTMSESAAAADDTIKTIESSASLTALPASVDVADVPASLPTENDAAGEVVQKLLSESAVERELSGGDLPHSEDDEDDSLHRMQTLEVENNNSNDKDGGLIMVEKEKEDRGTHQSTAATSNTAQSTPSAMETSNNISEDHDNSEDENHISGASDIDDSSSDDSSMEDETSLDNSLSLTDLNMSNSKSSTIDNNNTNDNDNGDGVANKNNTPNPDGGPLPKPPRHFLCPIQNTLLVDPVIDREGHTYERDAILRWLVLTSQTFDGDASKGEEKGGECKGRASTRRGRSPLSSFGRGTSPITGNPMSVEELVEDKVVKGAIERWRKECWVRFLLGNKGYNAEDDKVKFLLDSSEGEDSERGRQMERDVKDKKVSGGDKKPTSGNNGGRGLDDLHTLSGHKGSATSGSSSAYSSKSGKSSGAYVASSNSQSRKSKSQSSGEKKRSDNVHRSSGSSSNNKSSSKSAGNNGNKSKKDGKSSVPHVVSPSPTTAKSHSPGNKGKATIRKQNPPPPPPPPKELKSRKQDRSSLSNSQKSTKRKGLSSISSSQKTAVTSNTTLTAHSTPSTIKPHSTSATSSIPLPPLASPHTANSKSKTSSSESPHASPITSPKVPIKNIHTSSSQHSSFSSNLSDLLLPPNSYDAMQFTSANSQPRAQHNGWSVPLGVHKVICAAPGLRVTTQIHRRSIAVKVKRVDTDNRTHQLNGGKATLVSTDLIIPPGSYIEILETQVHGDRVRGRICWEEEEEIELSAEEKKDKQKKGIKKRTSRLLKRTSRKKRNKSKEVELRMVRYEGWISLQWAKGDESNGGKDGEGGNEEGSSAVQSGKGMATDEDSGPWTEPVPLGVYRINFAGGLPLRETPERDSTVLGKLDRGRCVEVVQTQVKGDRVRARVIVPTQDEESSSTNMMKFTSGWISLLNAITGSSGASPVPLGAYVVVAEPGCVITEGGGLGSKVKGTLVPGSCMEVVATRMEEGVVRGLIDGGGHVTLFVPPRNNKQPTTTAVAGDSNEKATTSGGRKNADGGRMFAMPVPLGTYQIIQNGLSVTTGISSSSSILMKLQLNATAEIVETRVEDGRVRGRICAVTNEDGSRVVGYEKASAGSTTTTSGAKMGGDSSAGGWINLFEPNQRWAKIVCFKGGRPVGTQRRRSSAAAVRAAC